MPRVRTEEALRLERIIEANVHRRVAGIKDGERPSTGRRSEDRATWKRRFWTRIHDDGSNNNANNNNRRGGDEVGSPSGNSATTRRTAGSTLPILLASTTPLTSTVAPSPKSLTPFSSGDPSLTTLMEGVPVTRLGSSNAASDAAPNALEVDIITSRRYRRPGTDDGYFNHNWNNLQNEQQAEEDPDKRNETQEAKTGCCCCEGSEKDDDPRDVRDARKVEISGDVDLPSTEGIPDFRLRHAPSNSLRQAFTREYKIFWNKLVKRFGAGKGEGELIAPDGTCPSDHDLVQARHLYESIPVLKEHDLRIAKRGGERVILGKGNNGAVLIAFYSGPRRDIPEGVALKIFFRSSIISVRKEALLSILAAQGGYAPKVYGIVYLKKIDAYGLIVEFIPRRKNANHSVEAWTLRMLIHDEKDRPSVSADELFKLSLRMAVGLQTIHDQHVIISDIKTDNVLLQANESGAIIPFFIDYGLSGFCKGKELNVKGRSGGKPKLKMEAENFQDKFPHYPPEVARGECTSKAGDVYGLGRLYMRMFRAIKAIKRHPLSKQYFQAFHACMRDNPRERLRLEVLKDKLTEIVIASESDNRNSIPSTMDNKSAAPSFTGNKKQLSDPNRKALRV